MCVCVCVCQVRELRKRFPELDIQVDGGINEHTVGAATEAGANVIVSGSGIFKAANKAHAIQLLRESVLRYLSSSSSSSPSS